MSKENTIINSSKDVNYYLNRNVFDAINNSIEESKNINDNNISGKNKGKNLYNKNNKRKNNNYIRKEYKELNINEKQFEIRRGDWFCQYCYNLNFAFRTQCNRCNNSKIVFIFGIKKSPLFRKLCFR
jgi:hypothetical protein